MLEHAPDLLENVRHGQADYPVQSYLGLFSDDNALYLHWHEELELTWVDSGEVVYKVDLEPVLLRAGDLMLLPPGSLHEASSPPGGQAVTRTLVFHPDLLKGGPGTLRPHAVLNAFLAGEREAALVLHAGPARHGDLPRLFETAFQAHLAGDAASSLLLVGSLWQLVGWFLAGAPPSVSPRRRSSWVNAGRLRTVYAFVQRHYAGTVALEDVARLANLGVSSFCRFFKAATGETFATWLVGYRLRKVKHLLISTDLSLAVIAEQTGFGSQAYLNRCFRRAHGEPPARWRSEARKARLSNLALPQAGKHNSPA